MTEETKEQNASTQVQQGKSENPLLAVQTAAPETQKRTFALDENKRTNNANGEQLPSKKEG